jgi:hypothetical protein
MSATRQRSRSRAGSNSRSGISNGSGNCPLALLHLRRAVTRRRRRQGPKEIGPSPNARRTMGRPGWMVRTWTDPGVAPQTKFSTSRLETRSSQMPTPSGWRQPRGPYSRKGLLWRERFSASSESFNHSTARRSQVFLSSGFTAEAASTRHSLASLRNLSASDSVICTG